MNNGNLGFGLMRLPQRSAEPTDIDTEPVSYTHLENHQSTSGKRRL